MEPDQTEWKRADVDRILQRETERTGDSIVPITIALFVALAVTSAIAAVTWLRDDVRAVQRAFEEVQPCRP